MRPITTLRHPLTGQPILPVYVDRHGRPRYPFIGAADGGDDKDQGGAGDGDKDKGGSDYKAPGSQADLDRIISDRLAREREKFADYADLKKKAAAHDATMAAAMTESEKAVAAARKEGEDAAQERANTRLLNAEARALAAAAKFRNPATAVRLLDLSGVAVQDDGVVDAEAIKTKLKDLSDAEPYLVDDGKPDRPKPDRSQGNGTAKKKGAKLAGLGGSDLYDRLHPKKTS